MIQCNYYCTFMKCHRIKEVVVPTTVELSWGDSVLENVEISCRQIPCNSVVQGRGKRYLNA